MGLLSSIGKAITTSLDYLSGAFTNPVTFVTNPAAAKDKFLETNAQGLSGQISNVVKTVGTTATAAAIIVGGGAAAGSASAKTIGGKAISVGAKTLPKLIPKTLGGKAIAAVAVPVGVTALIKNPGGAANTVGKAVEAQIDLGSIIADPSKEGAIEFLKEHPVTTGVVGAAAALAVGKATTGIVSTILNTKAIKENTAATKEAAMGASEEKKKKKNIRVEEELPIDTPEQVQPTQTGYTVTDKSGEFKPAETPVLPATNEITEGETKKKRRYRKHKVVTPSIRQNVNVVVKNNAVGIRATKRFINKQMLPL